LEEVILKTSFFLYVLIQYILPLGMGVAPDVIINGAGNCGRSSVPIGAGGNRSETQENSPVLELLPTGHQLMASSKSTSDSPPVENRHPLKKRLLDAVAREAENASGPSSSSMMMDVVVDDDESSTKVPKIVSIQFSTRSLTKNCPNVLSIR
jgi:hypothetical protein